MKKSLSAITALLMAFSLAACSDNKAEDTSSETVSSGNVTETSAEPVAFETEESVPEADTSDFSFIGKWYFISTDMTSDGITLAMSLKDMEISELTAENSFILDIKDGGTVDISAYGENASAAWTASDSGITITGDEETLGADVLKFTAEDTDLIRTALAFEEESMNMYFAKEGSPKIAESMNKSLLEDTFGVILSEMISENMTELTAETPAVLTYSEDTEAMYCGFTAPEAGSYTFRSESDGYDIAAVYSSSSFAEALATSDNTEGGFELTLELEAEQTIYIEVTSGSSQVTVTAQKN
ncbi:MAG: hypothetical protein ACI4J0_09750 [Huintestinicola sp.]|uniref:hypothetical protein n=1 Tax=Huintestinicola sp. TaxID=2981661 RepID=UPI003F00710A